MKRVGRIIDVSEHNGVIDWDKAWKTGSFDGVMIRMGYGEDTVSQDDTQFHRNVRECERLAIPYGVYFYSYALRESDVKSEIEHARRLLQGLNLSLPVSFDMEDGDEYKYRHRMPSPQTLCNICYEWLDAIESDGYYVSLYANKWWLENWLTDKRLERFDKWVAQWGDECTYKGVHYMWQYTNHFDVEGIPSHVDASYSYTDFHFIGDNEPKAVVSVDYQIQPNDSLWRIAMIHNTSVDELMKLNPQIGDKDLIFVGDIIQVPKR